MTIDEYIRKLLDQLDYQIILVDSAGIIRFYNESFADFARLRNTEDALSERLETVLPFSTVINQEIVDKVKKVIESGTAAHITVVDNQCAGMEDMHLLFEQVVPVDPGQGAVMAGIIFRPFPGELPDAFNINDKLQKLDAMAALSDLIAGVAHEVKTPLGSIISNNDIISRCLTRLGALTENELISGHADIQKEINKYLAMIREAVETNALASNHVLNQINSLRQFMNINEEKSDNVDLHEILEEVIVLTHHISKNRITFKREYNAIPLISCYRSRLGQVFLNMITNAIQAIEGKGEIIINTSMDKNNVIIRFTDTGKGIPDSCLNLIFNKGYTTKEKSEGCGFGLSICMNIIKKHNGSISVQSEVGRGSTFSVILPAGNNSEK